MSQLPRGNRHASEIPPAVHHVARQVAAHIGVDVGDLFVADHTHEDVSEGSWTIAYEGAYEWPMSFIPKHRPAPAGWGFECQAGWCLLMYPEVTR